MKPRRGTVLCLRGGALGDFLLTRPALRRLRAGLPEARVVLAADRRFGELARTEGLVDEVLRLDHAGLSPFFARGQALPQEWVERFQEAAAVVSWLFDPLGLFVENLERIGVRGVLQGCWKPVENGVHASVQLGRVLEGLALFEGDEGEDTGMRLDAWSRHGAETGQRRRGSAALQGRGGKRGAAERMGQVIGFHPGSGGMSKVWPWANWLTWLDEMRRRRPDWRWVMVTGEAEEERGLGGASLDEWRAQLPAGVEWLRNAELSELARAMAGWRGFVGHDTGPSHLAAAAGLPVVTLFGPTDPAVWAPLGAGGTAVLRAPQGELRRLEVGAVAAAVERMLG